MNVPDFQPEKKSPMWKSDRKDELLDIFKHGVQDIAEDRVDVDYVVAQLCDCDPSLSEKRMTKEVTAAVKKFSQITALTTGLKPEEVNAILSDETKRVENVASIRRGVAGVFLKFVRTALESEQFLLEMDPKVVGEWYKVVRQEEDRERELMLRAKAEAREDAKFRLMFFDFVSGSLGSEDIEFLNEDLKKDLAVMLNARQDQSSRRVLEGAAAAPSSTGTQ